MVAKALIGFSFILAIFCYPISAKAVDLEVVCDLNGCSINPDIPLFTESNIYPGWSVKKQIRVINNYEGKKNFAIEIRESVDERNLATALMIEIRETFSGSVVYQENTLDSLVNQLVFLSNVHGQKDYDIEISLPSEVGNEFQGKNFSFDLGMGFLMSEVEPTPTPTATFISTINASPDDIATDVAVLTPTPSPSEILGALTDFPIVSHVFTDEVLGEEGIDGIGDEAVFIRGDIEGVIDEKSCSWWKLGGLGLFLNSAFVYLNRKKLKESKVLWLIPASISLAIFLADSIAHQWVSQSIWCNWMWLISLASFLIPSGFYFLANRLNTL